MRFVFATTVMFFALLTFTPSPLVGSPGVQTVSDLVLRGTAGQKPAKVDSFAKIVDDPALPRVLLIGDSISIGYTAPVRKMLAGKANLHRIPENAADTKNGVAKLEKWLGSGKWDVIHFNWGLHDIKLGTGAHQVPIAEYEKNLDALVAKLKATGAKLIWCATTPVPSAKLNPPRLPADVVAYNAAAARVMEKHGVTTNDLYAFALPKLDKIQQPANVHFSPAGSEALAEAVTRAIVAALPKR